MKKHKRSKDFIHKAYYKGGTEALRKFVKQELKYPEEALKEKIEGSVSLRFEIDHFGKIHHIKVVSGLGYGCDEEAIRLISMLKYEVQKSYKMKVNFKKKMNVHFKLPIQKAAPKKSENLPKMVSYTITPSEKKGDQSKKQGSYSYTIKY